LIDATTAAGGRMFGQSNSLGINNVSSFYTNMPFDKLPGWVEFRSRPIDEQKRLISDPVFRERLIKEAAAGDYDRSAVAGPESRPSDHGYLDVEVYDDTTGRNLTVAAIAAGEGRDPVEVMLDRCIRTDFQQVFLQSGLRAGPDGQIKDADLLEIMKHPHMVMTFSDTGAHVSQIISCVQSYLLGRWVRRDHAFSLEHAVRMLTLDPALAWSIPDRGLLREGAIADINVFDPETVGPALPSVVGDLPSGARRIVQRSDGFLATIVGGEVTLENCEPTGAFPGRLLRGRLAAERD
jgi:N-acyl-D-amino-acid deacylase